jgi:HK97 family phage major capsid protein
MPTNSQITRADAGALIPEDVQREIVKTIHQDSVVLRLARRLPNMTRAQRRIPVLNALASAYFVAGDTGLKQTTEIDWTNVYINAEELAVIVPVPEAVLDDVDYDIWGEVMPEIRSAIGYAVDRAILHGTNAPASWPSNLMAQITSAGHTVDDDDATYADLYDLLLGVASDNDPGAFGLVEQDGFMVSGAIAHPVEMSRLRGLRDANGQPIFKADMQGGTTYALDGRPIVFPDNDAIDVTAARYIVGDWSKLVYAIRQDLTTKVATEAVIQNQSGGIEYNLFQQDMVALRVTMRLGWALPNPINRLQQTAANRLMFAAVVP